MSTNIYKQVANYVTALYERSPHPNLLYHNLAHTKSVVERTQEIAAHYQLNETEMLILYVAAWFHDSGHLFAEIEKHEDKSVELFRDFATQEANMDATVKAAIEDCILSTRMPRNPKNKLHEILCDADTYNLGTKEFKGTNKLVRKEFALRGYGSSLDDWYANSLDLLEKHVYYTPYCKALLDERKQKNIKWLKSKVVKKQYGNLSHNLFDPLGDDEEDIGKLRNGLLNRGIQTMFRLTSENHFRLSELADRKANLLISVNSIIISLILSVLVRRLADAPHLTIPAIIFLLSSLGTIIIAIMATSPKITEGTFAKEDVLNKKTNLIFFGNFYKASLEEYEWAMSSLMKNNDYLYGVLVKDIYQIGVILGRKYKLIRWAYNVFMVGLIVSVISFFIASVISRDSGAPNVTTAQPL
jgi:predicted metal-dependent HD superfamily phosphohydrolase